MPCRICWLGYGERAEFGVAINDLVKRGEVKVPIVIGRDHLDTGAVWFLQQRNTTHVPDSLIKIDGPTRHPLSALAILSIP